MYLAKHAESVGPDLMRRSQDLKLGDGQIKASPPVSRLLLEVVAAHARNNSARDRQLQVRLKAEVDALRVSWHNRRSLLRASWSEPSAMKISIMRCFHSVAALLSPSHLTHDMFTNAPAEFPHALRHRTRQDHVEHPCDVSDAVLPWQPGTEWVSHDSNKFVHPGSFWITLEKQSSFLMASSPTLSNARLVAFAMHDSTDWTQASGLLMPRYRTPAGSAEPTFPSKASVVSVWESLQTPRVFLHHSADKARALKTEAAPDTPRPTTATHWTHMAQ